MEPRQFPLRRAQGVCYSATPVPVTNLGFVPVTCPCYAQSVPVTSNPRVSEEEEPDARHDGSRMTVQLKPGKQDLVLTKLWNSKEKM